MLNSAASVLSGSTENTHRVRTAVFGFLYIQLQTFVKMKNILNRAQNSKQNSHTQPVRKKKRSVNPGKQGTHRSENAL